MAIVVEDGTGVENAVSYAAVAFIDGYWGSGNAEWTAANEADKEIAAARTSEFLDINYMTGRAKLKLDQGLQWPGEGDVIKEHLPTLQKAVAMIAPHALTAPLLGQETSVQRVTQATDKVGEISESRTYADEELNTTIGGKDFGFLDKMMSIMSQSSGIVAGQRARG